MSEPSQNPNKPNLIVEFLVNDIFNKNGVEVEKVKSKLSEEQKQMLKAIVRDLTEQVNAFLSQPNSVTKIEKKE